MVRARSTIERFVLDNSLLLLGGTIAAVVWANVDLAGYERVAHPLHFWVNDVGMVFFFARAAKEVFEATLPGGEERHTDTLNQFEHWWATPVQFVLLLFGFANAGVPFAEIGPGTYYVVTALLLGKPVGIVLLSSVARLAGAHLPPGLRGGDLLVVGVAAGIGFTVSLFFATAAFPPGAALDETKMGALLSFIAAPIAIGLSRILPRSST